MAFSWTLPMMASHNNAIDITTTPIKSKFGDVLESAEKRVGMFNEVNCKDKIVVEVV